RHDLQGVHDPGTGAREVSRAVGQVGSTGADGAQAAPARKRFQDRQVLACPLDLLTTTSEKELQTSLWSAAIHRRFFSSPSFPNSVWERIPRNSVSEFVAFRGAKGDKLRHDPKSCARNRALRVLSSGANKL